MFRRSALPAFRRPQAAVEEGGHGLRLHRRFSVLFGLDNACLSWADRRTGTGDMTHMGMEAALDHFSMEGAGLPALTARLGETRLGRALTRTSGHVKFLKGS